MSQKKFFNKKKLEKLLMITKVKAFEKEMKELNYL